MPDVEAAVATAVSEAFRILLTEKHLYQSVEVDLMGVRAAAAELWKDYLLGSAMSPSRISNKDFLAEKIQLASKTWIPANSTFAPSRTIARHGREDVEFSMPTINTFCSACDHSPPHNPVYDALICLPNGFENQWFYLGYECQQCKGIPVRFLVRREGMKLRLAGRDPIEVLPTPKVLPKGVSRYFSDAQIAHHAGQTLAGIFLLRVFIEQYWRSLQPVKDLLKITPRATGDEQGNIYQDTLPTAFKDRFPSLKDVYGQLSAALHAAEANAMLFDESCAKIVRHFDARRLFELM